MPRRPDFTPRFNRQLARKHKRAPDLAAAVIRTVEMIVHDPENRGLNAHLLDRRDRIWEAYVTKAARVTYQVDGDAVIFRNNCRHDIIDRRQW